MLEQILKIIALCIVLASAETLHGIARTVVFTPRIGKKRALKVSIFTGTLLAFVVCYFLVPGIGYTGELQLAGLGLFIAAFMASFDIALGRFLLKKPWSKIMEDFNPRTGNYLLYGLLLLASFPYLVMKV